jgi:hypothetical protein
MQRMTSCVVAAVWLWSAVPAGAQEKYTIAFKDLGAGESARVEVKENTFFKIEALAGAPAQESKFVKHWVYTETVLDRPAGLKMPNRAKRTFDKALSTDLAGGNQIQIRPYEGKTVLLERNHGRCQFSLEDGTSFAQDSELAGDFYAGYAWTREWFQPPGPVAVGAAWPIDSKAITGGLDGLHFVKILKAEGTARLVEVYKKQDRLYALMEAKVELSMREENRDDKGGLLTASEDRTITTTRFEGCIDGTFAEGRIHSATVSSGLITWNLGTGHQGPLSSGATAPCKGKGNSEYTWKELPRP